MSDSFNTSRAYCIYCKGELSNSTATYHKSCFDSFVKFNSLSLQPSYHFKINNDTNEVKKLLESGLYAISQNEYSPAYFKFYENSIVKTLSFQCRLPFNLISTFLDTNRRNIPIYSTKEKKLLMTFVETNREGIYQINENKISFTLKIKDEFEGEIRQYNIDYKGEITQDHLLITRHSHFNGDVKTNRYFFTSLSNHCWKSELSKRKTNIRTRF